MTPHRREAIERYDDIDGVPSPPETRGLVGHEPAKAALEDALRSGRLHHAWLLQGPRGIGKATLAFHFARRLLADGKTAEDVFRQVEQGAHPQIVHVARPAGDRGGFRTQITVEEIRRLAHVFQTTAGNGWRIAIIDPAEDMNRNAANALLKLLEEPPARSIFLLVNHQPGRLLPTIRSRCRVLRLDPLADDDVSKALAAGLPRLSAGDRDAAVARAGGSARAAFLMAMGGGAELVDAVARLYAHTPEWSSIQKLADQLAMKGREASWDLMEAELFDRLASEAASAATLGDASLGARLARLWQEERNRWREASAFNLDRKQVLLTFFARLEEARGADMPTA